MKKLKNAGVYCIENINNGKFYIGSAKNFDKRFYNHYWRLINNCHQNKYLQNAWNKYGESSFEFNILQYVEYERDLLLTEQLYLDALLEAQQYIRGEQSIFLEVGYNLCPTAGATYGYKASKEEIERNRQKALKQWSDPKYRKKRERLYGSKEWKDRMFKISKQNWKNPEIRKNIIESLRQKHKNPKYKEWWSKNVINDKERLKKVSQSMKRRWQDPSYREKKAANEAKLKQFKREKMQKQWNDPEWRKMQEDIRASKQYKEKRLKNLHAYYERIGDNSPQNKRVGAFDPNTHKLIKEYKSLKLAKQQFGKKCIKHYITNYPKPYHGFVWKYID